jgi:hypothetical protein
MLDNNISTPTEPSDRKSQVVIEYAYRSRETDPKTWVFWVHASSGARFEESYRKIAERLQLYEWKEQKADILGMVQGWLSDENKWPVEDGVGQCRQCQGDVSAVEWRDCCANNKRRRPITHWLTTSPHVYTAR